MNYDNLILDSKLKISAEREKIKMVDDLTERIIALEQSNKELDEKFGVYCRASSILGSVADKNTETKINAITGVINKALALLFPDGSRKIELKQTMYRNIYPHFNVTLTVEDGKTRTFKQSGTGLAQVVSFLFTACLIDARGGRKVMVMDELLNGLHPDAKGVVKDLMLALSDKFQFIIVEYGLNIGKQYEVKKTGGTSTVLPIDYKYYDTSNEQNVGEQVSNEQVLNEQASNEQVVTV